MGIEETILKLKRQIEQSKTEKARLEGKLSGLYDQLKKECKGGTLEAARNLLNELHDKNSEAEKRIKQIVDKLEEMSHDW